MLSRRLDSAAALHGRASLGSRPETVYRHSHRSRARPGSPAVLSSRFPPSLAAGTIPQRSHRPPLSTSERPVGVHFVLAFVSAKWPNCRFPSVRPVLFTHVGARFEEMVS